MKTKTIIIIASLVTIIIVALAIIGNKNPD